MYIYLFSVNWTKFNPGIVFNGKSVSCKTIFHDYRVNNDWLNFHYRLILWKSNKTNNVNEK